MENAKACCSRREKVWAVAMAASGGRRSLWVAAGGGRPWPRPSATAFAECQSCAFTLLRLFRSVPDAPSQGLESASGLARQNFQDKAKVLSRLRVAYAGNVAHSLALHREFQGNRGPSSARDICTLSNVRKSANEEKNTGSIPDAANVCRELSNSSMALSDDWKKQIRRRFHSKLRDVFTGPAHYGGPGVILAILDVVCKSCFPYLVVNFNVIAIRKSLDEAHRERFVVEASLELLSDYAPREVLQIGKGEGYGKRDASQAAAYELVAAFLRQEDSYQLSTQTLPSNGVTYIDQS